MKDNQKNLKEAIAGDFVSDFFPLQRAAKAIALIQCAFSLERAWPCDTAASLEASTRIVPHLDWPGLKQVCRLERITRRAGKSVHEVAYAITSLSAEQVEASRLLDLWRGHWGIENRLHWVRDTAWQEDRCRIKVGSAPQNLAAFRNAAINLLRLAKVPNITAALRENAYRKDRRFARLGIPNL